MSTEPTPGADPVRSDHMHEIRYWQAECGRCGWESTPVRIYAKAAEALASHKQEAHTDGSQEGHTDA